MFKVGDYVTIKKGLILYTPYKNGIQAVEEMLIHCGEVTRIKEERERYYSLDIDNGYWCWAEDMLEPYNYNITTLERLKEIH